MTERISLQELIALNNTPKANALLIKYGYSPAKNYNDLTYKLFKFTKEYNEEALEELAKIHPHRDLILNYNSNEGSVESIDKDKIELVAKEIEKMKSDLKSNFSNIDGEEKKLNKNEMISLNQTLPLIMVAGIFSLVLVLAIKK